MASLNRATIIGRLGSDPDKKSTTTGKSFVRFSVATTDYYTDKSGERKEKTEWHRVVLWDRLADLVSQYCNKGSLVYMEGPLRTNEWQDREGVKRYTTEINVAVVQFLDRRTRSDDANENFDRSSANKFEKNQAENKSDSVDLDNDFTEDDIPF